MTMPNEKEQADIMKWEDERRNERITDRIYKTMSKAEERILKQIAPIQDKVFEHDRKVQEHDGFIANFAKSFSHVSGFLQKATGKK